MVGHQLEMPRQDPHATVAGLTRDVAVPYRQSYRTTLAWYDAATGSCRGQPSAKEPAIIAVAVSDHPRSATEVIGDCRPRNDFPAGRYNRDARLLKIGAETVKVQRMLICVDLA